MIKICAFNVLNLFLNLDKYRGQDVSTMTEEEWAKLSPNFGDIPKNKSLYELTGLASTILDIDADVFVLPEVGGYLSLKKFNDLFLGSKYKVLLHEENSKRGIYVGFLIKKNLEYQIKSFSQERVTSNGDKKFFSRNLNLVSIYKNEECLFHVMGVHLKSPRKSDVESKDVDSIEVRKAEFDRLMDIYLDLETQHQEPIFLAGDFNFDVMANPRKVEAQSLSKTDLIDIHTLKNSNEKERATYVFFQTIADMVIPQQLDFILFNKKFSDLISPENSGTYYFKNEYGDSLGLPETKRDKALQPSDHLPLILTLK